MKNYHLIILLTALSVCINLLKAQNVYIPDANFKAALVNNPAINTNGDTEIQVSEAGGYSGYIDVSNQNIHDMTGITAFISLTALVCYSNSLTSLDVSANSSLTYLDCFNNQLTSLNLNSVSLTYLSCYNNQIISLNISANTALTGLNCGLNLLTNLDVSNNTALTALNCRGNLLTSLNVSNNIALNYLYCDANQLSSLNVSANTVMNYLDCSGNVIISLDLSANTALNYLDCSYNLITSLNLNSNTVLNHLKCIYNQLANLNLSNNSALVYLDCAFNQLTSLNVQNGHNPALNTFFSHYNPNLFCIQVDSVAYANSIANWVKDSIASYSTNCNYTPSNCYAHFTMSPDTIPQTWFALNQCTGNGTINYVWSWGDGTPNDSTANPSHTYSTAGYYNICVSITDSSGCTNSYCDSSTYINRSMANAIINVSVVNQLPSYIITDLETQTKDNITIYPNPTKTTINIQSTQSNNSNVKIYDAIGQVYVDEKLTNQNTSLNILHLQSGIYFIKVGDTVQKFVKE